MGKVNVSVRDLRVYIAPAGLSVNNPYPRVGYGFHRSGRVRAGASRVRVYPVLPAPIEVLGLQCDRCM